MNSEKIREALRFHNPFAKKQCDSCHQTSYDPVLKECPTCHAANSERDFIRSFERIPGLLQLI